MVKRLPYGSLPVVSKAGGILEYPSPLLNDFSTDAIDGPTGGKTKIGEDADKGHRHFSHMHWLYPGVFIPKTAHAKNGGTVEIEIVIASLIVAATAAANL